jgi:gliding motility-associated protein GldM
VQSASVQALYLNCGNELNIQVPALGSIYDPSFSATGASVIKGANKGLITVIPTAANVSISVSSGGNFIDAVKLSVKTIPKPTIEVYAGGKPVDEKRGMTMPRSLEIAAIPDESFKNFLPKDARYRISEWTVTLARGARPVSPPLTVTAGSISLGALAAQARPGDRLVIEVLTVQRMNYKGEVENVKMPTIYKNISIN